MEKIKVGDYVRTKDGEITRIVDTNMFDKTIYKDIQGAKYYLEDIVKHSPNIIDLIEVGDYVNGKLIHKVDIGKNYAYIYYGNCKTFTGYQIKSIVTKEQFKIVSYEV